MLETKKIDLLRLVVRISLGLMFVVSAILKLITIDTFELYIYSFHFLNFFLSELLARGVIMLELVMGILMIIQVDYKWIWRLALAVTAAFTLFLVYVVLFRNDDNCHCFGDIIEVDPLTSIFKNLFIMALFFIVRPQVCPLASEPRWVVKCSAWLFHLQRWLLQRKRMLYTILLSASFLVTYLLFPPNNVYDKIFTQEHKVVESVFDQAYNEGDTLYDRLSELTYDVANDTVMFVHDSVRLDVDEGRYLVAVLSAGCKYCKQSCSLVHTIFDRNEIPCDRFKILMWGNGDAQFAHFIRITETYHYDFRIISPFLAIDMVYGNFPTFLLVEDGKIVDAVHYRGLSENQLVDFLMPN